MLPQKKLHFAVSIVLKVFLFVLLNAFAIYPALSQTDSNKKNVLILHAQDQFLPANIVMDKNIYASLRGSPTLNVEIYSEYLEKVRLKSEETQKLIYAMLHHKYDSIKFDLIFITDDLSWDFYQKIKTDIFVKVPVVFCGITAGKVDLTTLEPHITGNFKKLDIRANIDVIRKILPQTDHIVIIAGISEQDALYEKLTRDSLSNFDPKARIEFLVGLTLQDMQSQLSKLPKHSVVLYLTVYLDGNGKGFNPRDVIPQLRKATSVPIFGVTEPYLGYGIVGGNLASFNDFSKNAAEIGLKVLEGTNPSDIPPQVFVNKNYFDWKELKFWGISEGYLPAESMVVNKNLSVWEQYLWEIVGFVVFVILQTLLIFFLFAQLRLRRLAEDRLSSLNQTLEARVKERTEKLQLTNRDLEAFSYSISHDLRAPLRHIDGYVDLLNKDAKGKLSEKSEHYLQTIAESTHQMEELIDDLLSLFKHGQTEISPQTVEMNKVLSEALSILEDGTEIDFHLDHLPSVVGDYGLIRQVWVNLIGNAIKYSRKVDHPRVTITAQVVQNEAVFSVKDNGVGFDMKYADKLFGVFQRLHAEKDFEGNGIGLATCQRIITRHGGRIWAEAAPNRGATFFFTLGKDHSIEKA